MKSTIAKKYHFSSAHFLTGVPEEHPCANMHGHNYVIEVQISGDVDEKTGFVVDYHDMDKVVKPIVDELDHTLLNDRIGNPTAERISNYILSRVRTSGLRVTSVTTWETEKCWAKVGNHD